MSSVDEYIREKLLSPEIESKVRAVVAMTTLLLGPLDVGNTMVAKEGIMEMILVMAGTDDILQQKVNLIGNVMEPGIGILQLIKFDRLSGGL